ncbi:MAG: DUF1501 domain-containing protein [Opitutae bacterium]|nr:DUF1501 domain-containing protein [Opitutae bacterium]
MNPENSQSLTRRQVLQSAPLGFGGLALSSILHKNSRARSPLKAQSPPLHQRAKRVIFLFMKGGPSHMDTFDYKPILQRDHGKPLPFDKPKVTFAKTGNLLASPWEFKPYGQCGHLVSELFPNVGRHVDDLCFLHSVHGTNSAHGGALLKLHTGSDNFVRPSMGSWISYGLGTENENLPSFITICPTLAHGGVQNWSAGFLPAHHQGSPIGNASITASKARVRHIQNNRWTSGQQIKQLNLIHKLNQEHRQDLNEHNPELEDRIRSFELAFRMQTTMPEAQDISGESKATRKLYGLENSVTEDFGHQCLMARRFAERGGRFIQVTHSDQDVQWDQHGNLRKGHAKKAAQVDWPIAGLLTDLKTRGLLEDTLVIWGGEFGRTPTVQGPKMDGRDHNPHGFTIWMAGGGVKGGYRHGSTDEYGYYAQEKPLHIHDFHATLLALLGIDHEQLTFRHAGRDFRLTDVHGKIASDIFA